MSAAVAIDDDPPPSAEELAGRAKVITVGEFETICNDVIRLIANRVVTANAAIGMIEARVCKAARAAEKYNEQCR